MEFNQSGSNDIDLYEISAHANLARSKHGRTYSPVAICGGLEKGEDGAINKQKKIREWTCQTEKMCTDRYPLHPPSAHIKYLPVVPESLFRPVTDTPPGVPLTKSTFQRDCELVLVEIFNRCERILHLTLLQAIALSKP